MKAGLENASCAGPRSRAWAKGTRPISSGKAGTWNVWLAAPVASVRYANTLSGALNGRIVAPSTPGKAAGDAAAVESANTPKTDLLPPIERVAD